MQDQLRGATVAFLVANEGAEQVELTQPWEAVKAAGGKPVLAAPKGGKIQAFNHLDKGDEFDVDLTTAQLSEMDFTGVVLPGGVANPDQLRKDPDAVSFIRRHMEANKPLAAICHAPWLLIEAGEVKGRTLTSWPSLETDISNAGGNWVDTEVVTDGPLTTSRGPDDLDAFCTAMVDAFSQEAALSS